VTGSFAAFNIADDTVISELHRQHRAVEFKKFLVAIGKAVPAKLACTWSATTRSCLRPRRCGTGLR
jgi:hypothetical protein